MADGAALSLSGERIVTRDVLLELLVCLTPPTLRAEEDVVVVVVVRRPGATSTSILVVVAPPASGRLLAILDGDCDEVRLILRLVSSRANLHGTVSAAAAEVVVVVDDSVDS